MLSLSLADRTMPPTAATITKYQIRVEYILNDNIIIKPIIVPIPAACKEIFHLRFTSVSKTEIRNMVIKKTLMKPGTGNLKKIYDEVA